MNLPKVSRKGQALLTVLIIATVLIILAAVLSESAFMDYTSSMADNRNSYANNAAQSAVEMCYDRLRFICSDSTFAATHGVALSGSNYKGFAEAVINELNGKEVLEMRNSDIFRLIRVSGDPNATAVTTKLYLQLAGEPEFDSVYVNIPVGITAEASYKAAIGSTETGKVYAIRIIKVYASKEFKLRGAVYTIGDMLVKPPSGASTTNNANITGDVYVYGSSPDTMTRSEQDYYGGIIAQHNTNLTIDGNAYSRSFIRTSGYGVDDNNRITILKDAIAQGIQVFSNKSKIVVFRDAYTFDDLEMNGEDSLIAVNGSFFGLSRGKSFHDESSAIVNSASIYSDSDEARRSRIVVNNNVMLNGGTFKYDPDKRITEGQIEDASVAWVTSGGILDRPLYSDWDKSKGNYDKWLGDNGYYPNGSKGNAVNGFGNVIQMFTPLTDKSKIDEWLNRIAHMSKPGYNDFTGTEKGTPPLAIAGFANYVIAANDTAYYISTCGKLEGDDGSPNIRPAGSDYGLNRAANLCDKKLRGLGFDLDILNNNNIKNADYWSNFWNFAPTAEWTSVDGNYMDTVPNKLNELLVELKLISPFFTRKEYDEVNGSVINQQIGHGTNNQFETVYNGLTQIADNNKGNEYIFSNNSEAAGRKIDGIGSWTIPDPDPTNPTGSDKLFLVVNTKPDIDIVLDGNNLGSTKKFNGIIFSTGKVILKNGAKLYGAVIAAGKGYSTDGTTLTPYVAGSACGTFISGPGITATTEYRVPRVIDANKTIFENGDYAAVQFESSLNLDSSIAFINPNNLDEKDPKKIRDYYINKFKRDDNGSIDLSDILK